MRVCPHCSYRRTLKLADRIEKHSINKCGLRYAVLAERNSIDLREGVALLWESWTRLRRSMRWKKYVRGCIVAMEVTYNAESQSWHPHLNVLMEGEFFPFEELNQAWFEATEHRGRTSFIRAADQGTVRELIKYVTKITDLLDDPSALDEFLSAINRRRLVRTYGTFYGLKVDDEESSGCCPDCGPEKRVSVVQLEHMSAHQVSLDLNGVLRLRSRWPDLPPLIKPPELPDTGAVIEWSDPEIRRMVEEGVHRADLAAAEDWAERRRWKQ